MLLFELPEQGDSRRAGQGACAERRIFTLANQPLGASQSSLPLVDGSRTDEYA